jgi:hypothetical protein
MSLACARSNTLFSWFACRIGMDPAAVCEAPQAPGIRHRGAQPGAILDLLVDPMPRTTLVTLAAIQLDAGYLLGVHVDVPAA